MTSEQETAVEVPLIGSLTYREAHAFAEGFYAGYNDEDQNEDYDKEKHYWKIGFVAGDVLKKKVNNDRVPN